MANYKCDNEGNIQRIWKPLSLLSENKVINERDYRAKLIDPGTYKKSSPWPYGDKDPVILALALIKPADNYLIDGINLNKLTEDHREILSNNLASILIEKTPQARFNAIRNNKEITEKIPHILDNYSSPSRTTKFGGARATWNINEMKNPKEIDIKITAADEPTKRPPIAVTTNMQDYHKPSKIDSLVPSIPQQQDMEPYLGSKPTEMQPLSTDEVVPSKELEGKPKEEPQEEPQEKDVLGKAALQPTSSQRRAPAPKSAKHAGAVPLAPPKEQLQAVRAPSDTNQPPPAKPIPIGPELIQQPPSKNRLPAEETPKDRLPKDKNKNELPLRPTKV